MDAQHATQAKPRYGPGRPAPKSPTRKQRTFAKLVARGVPPPVAAQEAGYSRRGESSRTQIAAGTQVALVKCGVPLTLQRIDDVVSDCLADASPEHRLRAADLGYKRLGAYVQINVNLTGELVAMRGRSEERRVGKECRL